ncbi:hypothetical protein BVRB_031950, partial [Beta vulgaris subsp. vulgaris]
QRKKLSEMILSKSSQSILALSLQKNSTEFFVQFKSLAAESDIQIKDIPKKKLKQIGFTMKTRLAQQVLNEQRPQAIVLSAIILLLYRVIGMILHAPFSLVDQLLEALDKSKIAKEVIDQVKAVKEEIANPTDKLNSSVENLRATIASEMKSQESS